MNQSSTSSRIPSFWQLVRTYTTIGILGFGGGFAVLSFIRSEVVARGRWLTDPQFDHIIEMSAFAPGATTINVLVSIAYRLRGWTGLLAGVVAVLWPSFLLILGLAKLTQVLHNPWLVGALRGVEIAVVGLLAHVVWTLWKEVPRVWLMGLIVCVATVCTLLGWNPALIILLAAGLGLGDFLIRKQPFEPPQKE